MQINGHIERLRRLEKGREFRIVQKLPVHGSVDHHALEPEFANAALQLGGGLLGILQRQRAERREAIRDAP